MNTEEKAKAYDEALERARKMLNMILDNELLGFPDQIREIFPQLRESEDERILQAIITGFENWKSNGKEAFNFTNVDDILTYLEKQKEQKPAEWSEEDEEMLNSCISSIEESKENRYAYKETDGDTSYDHEIAWLKSLPERFNLQPKQEQNDYITPHKEFFKFIYDRLINVHKENPNVDYMRSFKERLNNLSFGEKQEWSEEDERIRKAILGFLNPDKGGTKYSSYAGLVEWSNWLKSLRPSWKPSENQMSMLLAVVNDPNNAGSESCHLSLKSLYNDLKKL